jgi:signal transduction histidine kinase
VTVRPVPRSLQPLARLRLRLTAWYVATFCAILALLGVGLFIAIRRQLAQQLDDSLRSATVELIRAARIREIEATSASGKVVDAVDELHIPDRLLYLVDLAGHPVKPDSAAGWVQAAALRAAREGRIEEDLTQPQGRALRLHAERFALADGTPLIAVAAGDTVELEARYTALLAAFGAAAVVAIVLVGAGGWLLVRKSTAPVEHTIEYMQRFMADAAHELRTPITVLRSRAEVALQQPRDREVYVSALGGIEAEAQRLGRIVEDLFTLARADAGETTLVRQRVYLDDLALESAEAARAVAETRRVALRVAEFEEAAVDGDPGRLRQLIMILLDNALKFTQAGGEVCIRVGVVAGQPTVVVEDTGIGIGTDQMPHIFERFYRGDPARTRGQDGVRGSEGAGLGLAIARWIADQHGAQIGVSSTPSVGTKVEVRFPPAGV